MTHALMKGLAFLSAGAFLFAFYINKHEHKPLMIADLNGAAGRFPLAAFGLSVAVLALGGLPPLAGFMSKWQIFFGSVSSQQWLGDGGGHFRRAQQPAVAGLLRPVG